MATPRISFRCPAPLRTAISRTARKHQVECGEMIRRLLGESLGVEVKPLPEGFAGLAPEESRRIRSAGGKAKARRKTSTPSQD